MRSLIATVAVLGVGIALSASGALTVATAEAAVPCANKAEFKRVERGMTHRRVANILDSAGRLMFRSGRYMTREYPTCAPRGSIAIGYRRGHVVNKSAYWP